MNRRETADEIEEEAARWVWRLDREERTPAIEAALAEWLSGDTRRQGALLLAEASWAMLDRGSQMAGDLPLEHIQRRGVARRSLVAGGGAALAACLAGAGYVALPREQYRTAVGEIRRIPLKDGSTAAINTQSSVEVDLKPNVRLVKLARGEAWFQVAKNPERPFLVEAGAVRVQAVGTAFAVKRREDGAEILVSEGVVETWVKGAEGHRVRLSAGQSVFVAENAAIAERVAGPSEIDRQLAWRSGKIDLAGETLAEAAAEFNRYNVRKLVIANRALANQRFYGLFRTDDPLGFAIAVRHSLGAQVGIDEPGQIIIGSTPG
ncbi:MAG: FecR domain-containing protein [Phenylobacterium sp.]|uniref:FecR family protein n=1 Tax=Phenylobacterium sp. TaxID=1871053 RepID=UPI00271A52E3|nr:FecR domain-containing protein [Phenylobacterium sp.]MDO8910240.1 FecR domain-containing protein [Phenylobacterium sp.]MDP3102770.1 FecR domain-containing protein [Phenylobacterium sp.]